MVFLPLSYPSFYIYHVLHDVLGKAISQYIDGFYIYHVLHDVLGKAISQYIDGRCYVYDAMPVNFF